MQGYPTVDITHNIKMVMINNNGRVFVGFTCWT